MTAVEKHIEVLEKRLAELNYEMEAAGSDFAKIQTLSGDYKKVEDELATAWAEFEKVA